MFARPYSPRKKAETYQHKMFSRSSGACLAHSGRSASGAGRRRGAAAGGPGAVCIPRRWIANAAAYELLGIICRQLSGEMDGRHLRLEFGYALRSGASESCILIGVSRLRPSTSTREGTRLGKSFLCLR